MPRAEQNPCRAILKALVISPNNVGDAMICPRWRKKATTPGRRCKPGTYALRYSRSTHSTARVTWSRITSATFGMAHSQLSSFSHTYHRTTVTGRGRDQLTSPTRRFEAKLRYFFHSH